MDQVSGIASVTFIILTMIAIGAGELLIREAKNSDKKIGISANGIAKTTLKTQLALNVVAAFFIFAIALFIV